MPKGSLITKPKGELVSITSRPHPFADRVARCTAFAGGSVADVLDNSGLTFIPGEDYRVFVNGVQVTREAWETLEPQPGDFIMVKAVPHGGGGGKNPLRIIATIAVVVAASFLGQTYAPMLLNNFAAGTGLTALGNSAAFYSVGTALATAGLAYAGLKLVDAIAPLPKPAKSADMEQTQSFGIQGARNRMMPWGVIPQVLGRVRWAPPYAARPYTELSGEDMYLNLLFCLGRDTMIASPRIGETALEDYQDVWFKYHQAFDPAADSLEVFTNDVYEDQPGITLTQADGFHVRTTQADAEAASVDVVAPSGVAAWDGAGNRQNRTVEWEVQYHRHSTEWQASTGYSLGDYVEPDSTPWQASTAYSLGDYVTANGQVLECTTAGTSGSTEPTWTYSNGDTINDGSAVWTVRHFKYECTRAGTSGSSQPAWPTTPGNTVDDPDGGGAEWTCRAWSVGRSDVALAAQEQDMGSPGLNILYERYDRVVMDKSTGGLRAIKGVPALVAAGNASPPGVPSHEVSICKVHRYATQTEIQAADITDERTADQPDRANPDDFEPSASSPADDFVQVAAGSLRLRPSITARSTSTVRRGYVFRFPSAGQYDLRIRRETADPDPDSQVVDTIQWSVLRSIKYTNPVNMSGFDFLEMKIRANEQLNGIVDTFNLITETVCKDWDSGSETWIERSANNNASLYRYVLQGPSNKKALADSKIDLAGLQQWHEDCAAAGFAFNQVIDYKASVRDILAAIASAGRASPGYKDNAYGVVQDKEQTTPVQVFSPRNSWSFSAEKAFMAPPYALRVAFVNEDNGYQTDERLVWLAPSWVKERKYATGEWCEPSTFNGYIYELTTAGTSGSSEPTWPTTPGQTVNDGTAVWTCRSTYSGNRIEQVDFPGITDPDAVWKHGRFHLAQLHLRPETYQWTADVENLVCRRGSMVGLAHDVIMVGLSWGRIKELYKDSDNDIAGLLLDELTPMEAGKSYALVIRKQDGTVLTAAVDTDPGDGGYVAFTTPIASGSAPDGGDMCLFGESGKVYSEVLIKGIQYHADLSATITAVDHSPAVYQSDQGSIPSWDPNITLPPGSQVPVIDSVRSSWKEREMDTDGSGRARILVTFALSSHRDLHTISGIEGQYKPQGDGPWVKLPTLPPDAKEATIWDVAEGETYDIRFRYRYRQGLMDRLAGDWTATETHQTVIGGTPATPTGFSVTGILGGIRLDWTNPPDRNLRDIQIYRNTSDSKPGTPYKTIPAGAPGEDAFWADLTTPYDTTQYYWLIAVDSSDNEGEATASDSATPFRPVFRQTSEPSAGESVEGAIWIDTDDGNRMYYYTGASWVDAQDADIAQALSDAAQAISDAAGAQATADGKVTTFYQDSAPTAEGVGDLWVDTNDKNKLYRWNGSSWVSVRDTDIAQALSDAADAQSTADGKVVTFYQSSAPTAEGVGDLWHDTNDDNKLYRWSGSSWVAVLVDTEAMADNAITLPVSVTSSTGVSTPKDGWVEVQNLSINSTGAPIQIWAYCETYFSGGGNHYTWVRLRRGASTIIWLAYAATNAASGNRNPQVVLFKETPGAGTHTYYLDVYVTGENGVYAYNRSIILLETKK